MNNPPRRLGKYELQEPLGRGGMAEVWKAFDTQLQRYVAIKLMLTDLQANPDFVTRFTHEARIIAGLRHPNIVQIYDFHISEHAEMDPSESNTIAYMVMEYIKGGTLAHYIHDTSYQKQYPSAAEIIRLFTPISLAIDYAHERGMIHRDIKPANILLDKTNTARNPMGEPILSDFGLAKILSAASQTLSSATLGTPLYISPEQIQNRPVSGQTDIYSLGVVLYEIFTGVQPFRGDTVTSIMLQHLMDTPTESHLVNPNLPPALSKVLLKSLAKNPQDRFSSASALTAAIAEAFNLPVPEDLKQAISSMDATQLLASRQTPSSLSSPASPTRVTANSPLATPVVHTPVSLDAETVLTQSALSATPTVRAEAKSDPSILPDSGVQLNAQAKSPVNQPAQTPPNTPLPPTSSKASGTTSSPSSETTPSVLSPPPAPAKRGWLRIVLPVLLICILLGSGLGFFLFTHQSTTAPVVTNSIVGQAFFVSSGQVNQTTNQGINDEFQLDLQNIPNPQSGKSYYAWLLPDKSQVEEAPILLGTLPVNHGAVHFSYMGDSNHSNLLATTSRFLITEQDANVTISVPSPDLATWRYYAELPQTPAPGQTFSLLDHLRHLLASDPDLEKVPLHGGLNIWAYRNIQKILERAGSARDDWSTKDFSSIHRQIVSILDYLDGATLVQQDVPAGTPILADPTISQVGLLELHAGQQTRGYLYHIALHLNGVLSSPGSTQYQRNLATQINTGVNNVTGWLQQERQDAIQLVHMNDAQLALPSSLNLLNDMVTQANNAYTGLNNPSTGQLQSGISQVYLNVQRLATFEVKPYK